MGFDLFAEIRKQTAMFNEPRHLPQPLPREPRDEFDIWNDAQMKECIGGALTKPVQTLLLMHVQLDHIPADKLREVVRKELASLREAVKEEYRNL